MGFPIPDGVNTPIYVIGDSHIIVLYEKEPDIFANPKTNIVEVYQSKSAYAVGSEGHDYYLHENLRLIPDGSQVLLSFGEIDCRHYVPIMARKFGTSIETEVDKVIERYIPNCVRLLMEKFRVMIMGAYICPEDHNHYNLVGGETIKNPYGEIVEAKTLFNKKIKSHCEDNGILYIPLFEHSLSRGWDNAPIGDYFYDGSHLRECMVPVILNAMIGFKWRGYDT